MKFICILFLIPFSFIIIGSFVAISCFGSLSDSKLRNYTSDNGYSNMSNQTELEDNYINYTSPSFLSADKNKGSLIVKVTTLNGKLRMNTSSDFIVNIHANSPTPALFKGNSETLVKLSRGCTLLLYHLFLTTIRPFL
jgi:hypothetical protein